MQPECSACLCCRLSRQMEVTKSEAFSTSDGKSGRGADLIFSPALTFYILKGMRVSFNATTCAASSAAADVYHPELDKEVGMASASAMYCARVHPIPMQVVEVAWLATMHSVACVPYLQGTVLATVDHIESYILPSLSKEWLAIKDQNLTLLPKSKRAAAENKKSHVVTALKNWAVSAAQRIAARASYCMRRMPRGSAAVWPCSRRAQ